MTSGAASDAMLPRLFRVATRRRETADTFSFELVPQDGGALPRFAPGQFNMLYLFGRGEVAISISGDPEREDHMLHTVRVVGSVTHGFETLAEGAAVGVRGPFGTGWPLEQSVGRDVLFLAGGLGLAPLRPAILHAIANRDRHGRVRVMYGTRDPGTMLFRDEIHAWDRSNAIDLDITVDHPDVDWRGHVGVITELVKESELDPENTIAMICGPEIMMHATAVELTKQGVAEEDIYLSLERNMKCALGHCGHCQLGPLFVCRDGPVFRHDRVAPLLNVAGL
jgi:NAD(P)H-flavin reductase